MKSTFAPRLLLHRLGSPNRPALFFLSIILASPLSAQTTPAASRGNPDAPEEEVLVLSAFTVVGKTPDPYRAAEAISAVRVRAPLLDTASSITVLTRDMMDDLGPTRIFDATRYVAGVQDGRGIQFQDRMIIRGFESNGQRTVDNFIQPGDADNIAEEVVERIEVTKGPNAILAPSGAPGGSINVLTKTPGYARKGSLTAIVGLYDAQKVILDYNAPFSEGSPLAYRIIASAQDSRRYWDDDARLRSKVLAPMLTYRVSDRTQLTVKLIGAEHWIFREPLVVVDPSVTAATKKPFLAPGLKARSRNGIQPWSHVGTHSADLFTLLTTTVNEHLSLRFAANGRYYFEDSLQEFLSTPSLNNRYNPMTGELTQDFVWARNPNTNVFESTFSPFINPSAIPVRGDVQSTKRWTGNFQTDAVLNYRLGTVNSQTVTGVALSRQTATNKVRTGVLPPVDLNNPQFRTRAVFPDTFSSYNDTEFFNFQAYINQRLGLFEDRLFLTGSVLRFDTHTEARSVLSGAPANVLDDNKDMWSANALVKVRNNISVYYSYSTNSSPVIANNQPLWRSGVQDEIGIKTEFFDQRLSLNGAWFQIDQTNVTVPNPARQTDPTAPDQLVSDLSNDGYEFELMGRLTKNLSAIATYAHLDMQDNLGRKVRAVAANNAAVLLNYRFNEGALAGLALNAGLSYSGRRAGDTPINFTPLNIVGKTSFFLEPNYVTAIGASYLWKKRYQFRLNVDNVFDDKGHFVVAGGRVSGTGITTAPGINLKLTTTVHF